jgi:hypothetical protein
MRYQIAFPLHLLLVFGEELLLACRAEAIFFGCEAA